MVQDLVKKIRRVPDYPTKGILFYDVTTLFKDADALREILDALYEIYKDKGITKVVGVESRGLVLAPALAIRLGAGFVPARKPGKLPAKVLSASYRKEYGFDSVEIHQDALTPDDVVLVHDDLLATGGTVGAVVNLVRQFEVKDVCANFIIEIDELNGRRHMPSNIWITSLIHV